MLTKPGATLDASIKGQGEAVRKLKAEKADKTLIDEAEKKLLAFKVGFKAATGADWKPAGQKKETKGKENKKHEVSAPSTDVEKSETKKRGAKKAEKANKKAVHKYEEAGGQVPS